MQATNSHTTLLAALMAGGFVLFGIALFQSDVLPEPSRPVPVPWRIWVRRVDILFKPAVFLGALLAAFACAYDLEHARMPSVDLHIAEVIIAAIAFALLIRAVARNLLASLWRPASAPHLAPILRADEVDWLWVAAGLWVVVIEFLPVVVGPKIAVGLPMMVVTCVVLVWAGARLLRAQRVRSTKARNRRARHHSEAGWSVEPGKLHLGKYEVPFEYFKQVSGAKALTDEQFYTFRRDLKSTIYCVEENGQTLHAPPIVRRKFRLRGGVSQELRAAVPVPGRIRPLEFSIRMTRRDSIRGPRIDSMFFLISAGQPATNRPDFVDALTAHGSMYQPAMSNSATDIAAAPESGRRVTRPFIVVAGDGLNPRSSLY